MAQYKVIFPFIPDMGTICDLIVTPSQIETSREQALWHLNNTRAHDGLKPLRRLPNGVKFERVKKPNKYIYLYVIQANYGYGHGFEDLTASESWREVKVDLKAYRENMPEYNYRVIKRRELNECMSEIYM